MLIKGGKIVSSNSLSVADVRVRGERVLEVRRSLRRESGETVIDAKGLFVLPGMVDSHVHFRDFKDVMKEDWFSGSAAALAGGVTSVIEMPNSSLPTVSEDALNAKRLVASKKALCDYGFFFGATPSNQDASHRAQHETDVAGLKVFMGASTGRLLVHAFGDLYSHFSKYGKPIAVHAEDHECLEYFANRLGESHSKQRDPLCADLAVKKALALAHNTRTKLHVCHVTTREDVLQVQEARKRGVSVTCEVTPHHLFLDETNEKSLGAFSKVNPPLRSKKNRFALWDFLNRGAIDTLATDHAPHLKTEKARDVSEAPAGVPGLDTALPLMLNAVNEKKLSLPDVVRLYSFNPARLFGVSGAGSIAKGSRADLVLVDMTKSHEVLDGNLFTKCGWSPFEGWKLKGRVEKTWVRGQLAFDEGSIVARLPFGKPLSFG
ncbi:dihydroorotase family protein [Candidatus Micrarchaeota archaeon]|nr:dihydroorotase family protein [Candidatus Micrarchaeota archaeon]